MRRCSGRSRRWRRARRWPTLLAEITAVADDDPEDLAALDAVWEEAAVTFGPDPERRLPDRPRSLLARMGPGPPPAWTAPEAAHRRTEMNFFLFQIYPYIALTVLAVGCIARYETRPLHLEVRARASSCGASS